ncbi:MAG: GNAT family N-acetyltransferase [Fusobacteriaceae bacterium]
MHLYNTAVKEFKIRYATEKDCKLILKFINDLIDYEEMSDFSFATEESIYNSIFIRKKSTVIIGEWLGEPIATAIFFNNFSTFRGTEGVYIEDVFVNKLYRGKGLGKIIMSFIANYALSTGCSYMEWICLDWNKPSIDFYEKIGAKAMHEWVRFELSDAPLNKLVEFNNNPI